MRLLQASIFIFACMNRFSEACECGVSPSNRIYDGYSVPSSEFPWMAKLRFVLGGEGTECGATMISTIYAVTAGHCTPTSTRASGYLYFGSRPFEEVYYNERPNVKSVYVKGREPNSQDIALVKLTRNINVMPICLPPLQESFAGVKATMLGYGETESGRDSISLLAGDVVVPSNAQCGRVQLVTSTDICGGNYGGGPAFCNGDSGGPLMYHDAKANRWELIGVVSGSVSCSSKTTYGVFTRVSSFVPWIQQNSNNAGCQITAQ